MSKENMQSKLLALVICAALAGTISLVATYQFLRHGGQTFINDRVDERLAQKMVEGRVFVPRTSEPISATGVEVRPLGKDFKYKLLRDSKNNLVGIYVRFKTGQQGYMAEVRTRTAGSVVKFERGDGIGTFEVNTSPIVIYDRDF